MDSRLPFSDPGTTSLSRKTHRGGVNIVGVSFGYHDAACCIMRDGVLLAACQEERFSRVKNDRSFPILSLKYCLQEAGVSLTDVDCVAYYEDPILKASRQIWTSTSPDFGQEKKLSILARVASTSPLSHIREKLGFTGKIEVSNHHLSHAASSFYFSGFDEAAIFTVDGVGDWSTTTYGHGHGPRIEQLETVDFPDSLGLFYSTITAFLGFEVNEGEYKVMGLAPYGQPVHKDKIRRMIISPPGGQYRLEDRYFSFLSTNRMYSPDLVELLGIPPREPESRLEQIHYDIAKSAQEVLEEIMLEKVRHLHDLVPSENLCMAGGVALNVVANSRCFKEGPFRRLFVQPAAGDAGGALGAAALAHVRLTGERPDRRPMRHVYLGPSNAPNDILDALGRSSASFSDFRDSESDLINAVATRLLHGDVVGWCHGRMEFGPRSLGARSILADPRVTDMRDRINKKIKMREMFRPFAPAVLEEHAAEHFALDHPSPFMLEVCQVTSKLVLPAITHVDNSARVQTVSATENPRFAALIAEFHRRTGCPMLLNTSFNLRGEPIVSTYEDAILCFVRSEIDVLVLEDFILDRTSIPALWQLYAQQGKRALSGADRSVEHQVYTFL